MPTAASSTDWARDLADLRALVAFRAAAVRGRSRRRLRLAFLLLAAITVAATLVPAFSAGAGTDHARAVGLEVLPLGLGAFLLMAAGTSVGTGGGRELVARDHAVAFPVSPATDHLGALTMAPLNIAWLLQAWGLLGLVSYAAGPVGVLSGPPLVLAWVALATAAGQVAGWTMEVVRRGPHGLWLARAVLIVLAGVGAGVVATDRLVPALGMLPTERVADAAIRPGLAWPLVLVLVAGGAVAAVAAGVPVARAALRRPPREEQRLETGHHRARSLPSAPTDRWTDLRLLVRLDRASVLRSVPLRRGLLVLGVLPGVGAVAAGMDWTMLPILPGLVAAAVTLLFGINAWALDGRGALWRETLPVAPRLFFRARSIVLAQLTGLAILSAVAMAALRAGVPSLVEAVAVACVSVTITLQVVATSARWSVRNPFAMDLRSARAVPAPPALMLGYSARLAMGTTVTGMLFQAAATADSWRAPVLLSVPFVLWSAGRLRRAAAAYRDPRRRALVVTTVAA